MRIVVDIGHPAHVHYFKNFIWLMEKRGHKILITATDKDITYSLLNNYHLPFMKMGSYGKTIFKMMINLPIMDIRMIRAVNEFNPDIFLGAGSVRAAHAAFLMRKPCINFEDTEHALEQIWLYLPFVSAVLTPSCFIRNLGSKQIRFDGYLELNHLHPQYFTADPSILNDLHLSASDVFILIRFVSWKASHDIGQKGIRDKIRFVEELKKFGHVFISSESQLPSTLEQYRVSIPPEKMHDLLSYCSLYIGEGATMASEAALLGTPSIFISSLTGTMGNFINLEETYNLLNNFTNCDAALNKAVEILQNKKSKEDWMLKRHRMLKDKIDVTRFLIWFIENYPSSCYQAKDNAVKIQEAFR